MLNEKLFSLVESVRIEGNFDRAFLLASDMIEQGDDLPSDVEAHLINFITDKNDASFVALSKRILLKNLLDDHAVNIRLIAFLVYQNWLNLKDAAWLLSAVPHVERRKLPKSYRKVVEVADLVCEDLNEGFMDVTDDDLLVNALKAVV